MDVIVYWSMWADRPEIVADLEKYGRAAITTATIVGLDRNDSDMQILEDLFRDTNVYQGPYWDLLEPVLPANRSHTALSVGDHVTIDGRTYRCEIVGWERVSTAPIMG